MKRSHLLAIGMSLLFWICLLLILFGCSQRVVHHHGSVDDRLRGVEMPEQIYSDTIPSFSGSIILDPKYYASETLYISPPKIDTIAVWLLVGNPSVQIISQEKGYCVGTKYYPCEQYLYSDKTKVLDNVIVWNAVKSHKPHVK